MSVFIKAARKTMWMSRLQCVACAVVLGCCGLVWAAGIEGVGSRTTDAKSSKVAKKNLARVAQLSPWEAAERGRDTLGAIPEGRRTKANYTAAMDGYRAGYHGSPQDVHAP